MTRLPAAAKWVSPALCRLPADPVPGLIVWGQRRAVVIDCATATDEKNRPVTMLAFDVSTRPDAPMKIWLSVKQLQVLNPIVDLMTFEDKMNTSNDNLKIVSGSIVKTTTGDTGEVVSESADLVGIKLADGSEIIVPKDAVVDPHTEAAAAIFGDDDDDDAPEFPEFELTDADFDEIDVQIAASQMKKVADKPPVNGVPADQFELLLKLDVKPLRLRYDADVDSKLCEMVENDLAYIRDGYCHITMAGRETIARWWNVQRDIDKARMSLDEAYDDENYVEGDHDNDGWIDPDADTQDDDQPGWLVSEDSGDPLAFAVDSDTDVLPSPDTIAMLKDAAGYVPPTDIHADPYTERMSEIETPEQTILNLTGYLQIAHQTIQQQTTVVNDLRIEILDLEKKLDTALKAAKLPNPGELYTVKNKLAEAEKDRDYYRAELGKANDTGYKSKFDRAQSRIQELEAQLHQYQQPDLFGAVPSSQPLNDAPTAAAGQANGIQVMYWTSSRIDKPEVATQTAREFAQLLADGWYVKHEQFQDGCHFARLGKRQQSTNGGDHIQRSEAIPERVPVATIAVPEATPVNNGHGFPPVPPRPFGTCNRLPITPGSPFNRKVPASTLITAPTHNQIMDAVADGRITPEQATRTTMALCEYEVLHGCS